MPHPRPDALKGLRVIDLTHGPAGGLATMILADFGADVLLLQRPGGHALDRLAAAPLWKRGKRSLTLDLTESDALRRFHDLCAGADVLVTNWRPAALAKLALTFETLHERHPHLVVCQIGGLGNEGMEAELPGYEHLIAARTGRMQLFSGLCDRAGPGFCAPQLATHACAQSAASGILAALHARGDTGMGCLVQTSLLQASLAYEQGAMLGAQFEGPLRDLAGGWQSTSPEPPLPSLYYHPAQAADGRWLQFGNLLPHLFDNFLLASDLVEVLADPDFDAAQMRLSEPKQEAFRDRMLARFQEQSARSWMDTFMADGGIVATAYQTTQEALDDPDMVANGHVVPRSDGGVELGVLAKLTATPGTPGGPLLDDDAQDEPWERQWQTDRRPAPTGHQPGGAPLQGVRVVELATIIAAPFAASLLADMGAEVIKVETPGGDPYRSMAAGLGAARVNGGKQSVSIDLKAPEGLAAALRLLATADVVLHNFRPGVPERLGIGYDTVAALNPSVIYVQSNGYGPDGPSAQRPSTHPVPGAAVGGALYQLGERLPKDRLDPKGLRLWCQRLMRANEMNPDPNTAVVVTTAITLALESRRRTGQGQRVLVDMFGANAYANHDDFLRYPGKSSRLLPDEALYGLSATYRLYACAGDQWLFLAVTRKDELQTLQQALAEAGFGTAAATLAWGDDAGNEVALERLFMEQSADAWEKQLTRAGVGAARADRWPPGDFWWRDPLPAARAMTQETTHPQWGRYQRHGALVTFNREQPRLAAPPAKGADNAAVLEPLGVAVEALEEAGILGRPSP